MFSNVRYSLDMTLWHMSHAVTKVNDGPSGVSSRLATCQTSTFRFIALMAPTRFTSSTSEIMNSPTSRYYLNLYNSNGELSRFILLFKSISSQGQRGLINGILWRRVWPISCANMTGSQHSLPSTMYITRPLSTWTYITLHFICILSTLPAV